MTQGPERRSAGEPDSAVELLFRARRVLTGAAEETDPGDQLVRAHLGALRAASAMVALRSSPLGRARSRSIARGAPRDVWSQLAECAPELHGWAEFFARQAGRRAQVEAGIGQTPDVDESYRLLLQAEVFVDAVAVLMGVPLSAEREYPTAHAG